MNARFIDTLEARYSKVLRKSRRGRDPDAQSPEREQRARASAAGAKAAIIRELRRILPKYETLTDAGESNAAVEAFVLAAGGFRVQFRVVIEYGTHRPKISAVASFRMEEKRWEVTAVRVTRWERIWIEFDYMDLFGDVVEAARFCDALF